jgi:hypothetical protein
MYVTREVLTLAVNADGAATVYSDRVSGRVLQLRYVPASTDPLATGADLTITGEDTGVAIATLTNIGTSAFTLAPRQATHGIDGSASLYASAGEPVEAPVYLAGERIKCVVAEGGVSKSGTLHISIG